MTFDFHDVINELEWRSRNETQVVRVEAARENCIRLDTECIQWEQFGETHRIPLALQGRKESRNKGNPLLPFNVSTVHFGNGVRLSNGVRQEVMGLGMSIDLIMWTS